MSYKQVNIPNLRKGENGYKITDSPCKGCLVAITIDTELKLDGKGHFVGREFEATARWVDSKGRAKKFPGKDIPVTAAHRHTNIDGTAKPDHVITELLDGVKGNPKDMPSPIRRAIEAAKAMKNE